MKKKISKSRLKNNLKDTFNTQQSINKEHFLRICAEAKGEISNKNKNKQTNMKFGTFLKLQIKFTGWRVWGMQSLILLIIYILFETSKHILLVRNGRYIAFYLCCLAVLTMLTALPIISRTFKYKMYEIEMSSKISNGKLLMANLVIVAIGNIVMLCTILWLSSLNTSLSQGRILVYLLLPYLVTCNSFLYLLGHASGKQSFTKSILLVSIILIICSTLEPFLEDLFLQTFSASLGVICALLVFYFAYQIRNLTYRFNYIKILE